MSSAGAGVEQYLDLEAFVDNEAELSEDAEEELGEYIHRSRSRY